MGAVFIGRDENGNAIGEFYIDAYYDFNTKSAKSWRKKDLDEIKFLLLLLDRQLLLTKNLEAKVMIKRFIIK